MKIKNILMGTLALSMLLSGCVGAKNKSDNGEITICQFNLRCDVKNDGKVVKTYKNEKGETIYVRDGSCTWDKRYPLVVDFLRYNEVDSCGTQEMYRNQVAAMK